MTPFSGILASIGESKPTRPNGMAGREGLPYVLHIQNIFVKRLIFHYSNQLGIVPSRPKTFRYNLKD